MVVSHERQGHRGAFVIEQDGKRLAEMTYTVAGTRVIIDHTSIDDALRGTGAGRQLVQAAVEWARAENQRLISPASCREQLGGCGGGRCESPRPW